MGEEEQEEGVNKKGSKRKGMEEQDEVKRGKMWAVNEERKRGVR